MVDHTSFLKEILGQAKEGDKKVAVTKQNPQQPPLTAEERANLDNILGRLKVYKKSQRNLDINGRLNVTDEPVYYQPHSSTIRMAAGIPYRVSDTTDHSCNSCTRSRACERHIKFEPTKTDISLCNRNHIRMAVTWDLSDPENRKGTWRFAITEYFDHFEEPELERGEHEAWQQKSKDDEIESKGGLKGYKGCCPIEPRQRIKALAQRIIKDYNRTQEEITRHASLDRRGREYTTRPKHWGEKDPFTPAESSETRVAYEFKSSSACRVERELTVLLQAWYRGKVRREQRGTDRTTLNAKEAWANTMEAQKLANEMRSRKMSERNIQVALVSLATKPILGPKTSDRLKAGSEKAADVNAKKSKISKESRKAAVSEKSTKATKKLQNRRPIVEDSDESDKGEITEDEVSRTRKSTRFTTASNRHTKHDMEMYQSLADEVSETQPAVSSKSEQSTVVDQPTKPQKRASHFKVTAEERALLQSIREKQAEDVESEEEGEILDEEEIEDNISKPTLPQKLAESSQKKSVKQSTVKKTSKKQKTPTPESSPSPSPSPSPKPRISKRKAPQSPKDAEPAQKKSRKSYKSTQVIDDSDDEADYNLPAAPSPKLPEQREGWEFTESLSAKVEESVKVVQTDNVHKTEIETAVVVEQGTTIVQRVLSEDGSEGEVSSDEERVVEDASSVEGDESVVKEPTIADEDDEDDLASKNEASATSEVEQPNSADVVKDNSFSEVEIPSTTEEQDDDSSLSETESLSDNSTSAPTSQKRKTPFNDLSDDEEVDRPLKKAKKVTFSDDVTSPEARPRKMSLPYTAEDSEGDEEEDGKVRKDDRSDASEKGTSDEDLDSLFEE